MGVEQKLTIPAKSAQLSPKKKAAAPAISHAEAAVFIWSWQQESNLQPADYKSAALPIVLCQPSWVRRANPEALMYCTTQRRALSTVWRHTGHYSVRKCGLQGAVIGKCKLFGPQAGVKPGGCQRFQHLRFWQAQAG